MIKLSKEKYNIVSSLKKSDIQEVKSVINLITPGEVFVDSLTEPKIAVVYNQGMKGFYLIGDVADKGYFDSIKDDIYNSLSEYNRSLNEKCIEISSESEIGEARIEELLGSFGNFVQLIYVDTDLDLSNLDEEVISVTRDLNIDQFSNKDFLTKDLLAFWGSMENFYKYGRCKILVKDDLIVSIAYTGHVHENKHGIGIETLEGYRKKGYGYRVAYQLIKNIKEEGLVPYWDCTNDNWGSVNLANKLGLIRRSSYKCYWKEID